MKPGSTPPPLPDDEAADPLLTALRQRLGDYGQAPPPGAWAAIRQRVAAPPAPRPWWRRPRRLLSLLGVLMGVFLPGLLSEQQSINLNQSASARRANPLLTGRLEPTATAEYKAHASERVISITQSELTAASQPGAASSPLVAKVSTAAPHAALSTRYAGRPSLPKASAGQLNQSVRAVSGTQRSASKALARVRRVNHEATAPTDKLLTSLAATKKPLPQSQAELTMSLAANHRASTKESTAYKAKHNSHKQRFTASNKLPTLMRLAKASGTLRAGATNASGAIPVAGHSVLPDAAAAQPALVARSSFRSRPTTKKLLAKSANTAAAQPASEALAGTPSTIATSSAASLPNNFLPSGPVDLLAFKQLSLLLPTSAAPVTLAARPDSSAPASHLARRWALLVVAGPTLSYRTLGPAPTLAAGHPDFARLERPALGLGAQVQVRRVLSGRWALAGGLGYHEYATQLALSLHDTASVHQRDTYRLLTVPVQLSYALGAPKGRLTKGLLLGIEPGWYLGGRSTEGADCGCHQQTYSATGSPYRSWSLAFSLGFDLRYRLGGADSRWQWLVQPTGRYVATPFVRSDAVGFTRRQPFSLGLLTGFSWDVR